VDTREVAPGSLALVEEFLRSRNAVTSAADLGRWCADRDLTADAAPGPADVTAEAYERALRLREALRSLMLANNGGPADPDAAALVNAEIEACGLRPEVAADGSGLRWRHSETGLRAALLTGVVTAMADGTWPRMKACAADDCGYVFYDRTRNKSGRWCDVAGCGANARMRAYRRRRTT
jgi:predicted RNA-binding Zn ribbon-like protein